MLLVCQNVMISIFLWFMLIEFKSEVISIQKEYEMSQLDEGTSSDLVGMHAIAGVAVCLCFLTR